MSITINKKGRYETAAGAVIPIQYISHSRASIRDGDDDIWWHACDGECAGINPGLNLVKYLGPLPVVLREGWWQTAGGTVLEVVLDDSSEDEIGLMWEANVVPGITFDEQGKCTFVGGKTPQRFEHLDLVEFLGTSRPEVKCA